ncbi:MAG: ATP-binding cassette domain-containing protein [Sediminibacterium sp.]
MHILEADSIQLAFDGRTILSDIYLKLETEKITGLLGRNGAGKSCLLKIIFGSLDAEKSVRFDKQSKHQSFKIPKLITYLPQFNFIPKQLTINRIFQDFELDYFLFENRFPEFSSKYLSSIGSLSGGERRLIELYVILKSKAQFALLDEPFTHLSPLQIEKAQGLILEEKINKGILITDHLHQAVTDICDNLYVLSNGKTHLTKNLEDLERLGYVKWN